MMSRTVAVFIGLILAATTTFAQLRISGRVTDSHTGEALPFATVSLAGKAIGTITNTDGSFDLHIDNIKTTDTLMVSMIGYARLKIHLTGSLVDQSFKLTSQPVRLEEVVIVSVEDIFKKIKARVDDNYPVGEYQMECFYREIKKQEDKYRSLLEAALVIEDKGYNHQKSPEAVFIREIRGSSKFINRFSNFFQTNNLLRETLGLNAVRHPASSPSVFGKHPYKLRGMGTLHDRSVYVLESDTSNNEYFQRVVYVDTETYAIYRSEETVFKPSQFWKDESNDSIQMRLTKGTSTFDFRNVNGKLYLNHIRHDIESEYVNRFTKEVLDHFTIINELVITDVRPGSARNLPQMKDYALEQQVTPYNESFWNNYNAISQTPLEAQVMADLVKGSSLKDQFIRSSSENRSPNKKRRD